MHPHVRRRTAIAPLALAVAIAGGAMPAASGAQLGPLLSPQAFSNPEPCRLEPFTSPTFEQRERRLNRSCNGERLHVKLGSPSHGRMALEVDQIVSVSPLRWLTATARLGWTGESAEDNALRLHTGRALVAAGSQVRLGDQWALSMNVGRDAGPDLRTRGNASATYRPSQEQLVYMAVAVDHDEGLSPAAGLRWWLWNRRASLDLSAKLPAGSETIEPRLGLKVYGFFR